MRMHLACNAMQRSSRTLAFVKQLESRRVCSMLCIVIPPRLPAGNAVKEALSVRSTALPTHTTHQPTECVERPSFLQPLPVPDSLCPVTWPTVVPVCPARLLPAVSIPPHGLPPHLGPDSIIVTTSETQ